ncbi:3'-5' exonuclease [Leptolyngbya sp. FACHB-17]|uniref:3'-5' exonuclease n=1 Tax=unclassified Leptolyngbya TaxID=2650499 RepID=UPI001680A94A|nr:3'-5' exonuclease [Leptolyngbya sp. FACHB-17]MBD2078372.1 3'-5' exonuclease [Leptolyngbya sp. FACHB-17]
MIEQVLIIDTETTTLDPENGQVIEIGAILYSLRHQTAIQQSSVLLPAEDNPAESINRIKSAALATLSPSVTELGLTTILEMARMADVVAAHNAEFDRKWFGSAGNNGVLLPNLVDASDNLLPWVCTCNDFEWPYQTRSGQSLIELALAHGIGVYANHRALTDCQLLAALFDKVDNLQRMFERALRPKARFVALVSYDNRELAKQAGFKWFSDRKTWERVMVVEDAQQLPFRVKQLDLSA